MLRPQVLDQDCNTESRRNHGTQKRTLVEEEREKTIQLAHPHEETQQRTDGPNKEAARKVGQTVLRIEEAVQKEREEKEKSRT